MIIYWTQCWGLCCLELSEKPGTPSSISHRGQCQHRTQLMFYHAGISFFFLFSNFKTKFWGFFCTVGLIMIEYLLFLYAQNVLLDIFNLVLMRLGLTKGTKTKSYHIWYSFRSIKYRNDVLLSGKETPPHPCINCSKSDLCSPSILDLDVTPRGRWRWRTRYIPVTGKVLPVRSGAWLSPRGSAGNNQTGGTTEHC